MKKDKKIEKLEAKLEALLRHLKLDATAELEDEGYYSVVITKRKKYPWQ